MKKISYFLFVLATFFVVNLNGQNTFPSSGNVGIGTTTPSEALHLKLSQPQINLERTNSNQHCDIYFRSSSLSSSTPLWAFGMMGTSPDLRVWTWSGSSQSVRFTIKADGNVGIGTTNPSAKLHVSGNSYFSGNVGIGTTTPDSKLEVDGKITCEEIEVKNVSADYVFGKDFSLKTLNEVEAFINKNGHLPDVPSASETEKGVNISEFNSLLLQKIEELTLYTIEQQKKIEELQNSILNSKQ